MRCQFFALIAITVVGITRGAVAQPRESASNPVGVVAVPVCQWGKCASLCQEPCPGGTVCGVDGTCVQVANREQVEEVEEARRDEAQERRDAIRNEARRLRARYLMRASIGGGLGGVSLVGAKGKSGLFVGQLGMRQQFGETTGMHLQLVANYGLRQEHDGYGNSATLTLQEVFGAADVYFGPFRYFYLGPAAVAGYRWYSEEFVQWFAPEVKVKNHVVREGGFRFGLLVGSEEQFDIAALFTTSFNDDTPLRGQVTFAYEFR